MRISTSKSEAMVLSWKRVDCPLQVGGESLPQVEEFKYLRVLLMSEGKMEQEIDRWIGAASAVMWTLSQSVVVKRELSQKAKLSNLDVVRERSGCASRHSPRCLDGSSCCPCDPDKCRK